jgi:hypothetical protein
MLNQSDKRKNRRYPAIAQVRIPEAFSGEALLKDLSVTGCCIECTMNVELKTNSKYTLNIIPEKISKIGGFDLNAECKWIRPDGYSCVIGFDITESPKGKPFERYVDYLSWRSST